MVCLRCSGFHKAEANTKQTHTVQVKASPKWRPTHCQPLGDECHWFFDLERANGDNWPSEMTSSNMNRFLRAKNGQKQSNDWCTCCWTPPLLQTDARVQQRRKGGFDLEWPCKSTPMALMRSPFGVRLHRVRRGGGLKHEKITKVHGLAKSLVKYWFTIYFVLYRHWFDWKLNFIEFNEQSGNSASDPVQDAIVWRRERRNDFLQKWNPRPSSFISCVCVLKRVKMSRWNVACGIWRRPFASSLRTSREKVVNGFSIISRLHEAVDSFEFVQVNVCVPVSVLASV